jgi:hypothetical protein
LLAGRTFHLITAFRFFLNAQPELRLEVMRVLAGLLASDGILVFNNHMNRHSVAGYLTRLVNRIRGGENKTWRIAEMRALVRSAGLVVADVHHAGVLPGWERFLLLPTVCYRPAEELTSRIGFLRHAAQDVIFVCRRAET